MVADCRVNQRQEYGIVERLIIETLTEVESFLSQTRTLPQIVGMFAEQKGLTVGHYEDLHTTVEEALDKIKLAEDSVGVTN